MDYLYIFILPFMGTAIGASTIFLIKDRISDLSQKAMLGFASGVMIAATFWSLLQPALDLTKNNSSTSGYLTVAIGFLTGMCFLLLLDTFIPHQHIENRQPEGPKSSFTRSTKLILAVTLHNIPEGMAVGVVFAGVMSGETTITTAAAIALSVGMALQNIPEGAIISMPLRKEGNSKKRSFILGSLSGIVEPIAALLTFIFLENMIPAMPFLLAFAAGAMLYVVVEELIPASQSGKHSNIGTVGVAIGFVLMMTLDTLLN